MSDSTLPPFPTERTGFVGPPHPTWTYGTKVDAYPEGKAWAEGEKAGWTVVDAATENPTKLYQLMISGITPRPIGMISSVSETGVENLAVFSWFNMVSANPPVVSISISNVGSKLKDTAANIKATKGFTANLISLPFIQNANASSVDTPPDVSEWELSGLTKAPSLTVKAPRAKESAFSMECELFQEIKIVHPETQVHTTTLILGLVKKIHVRNDVITERFSASAHDITKTVDATKLQVVGRLGDISYTAATPIFRLPRPAWQNEKEKIEEAVRKSNADASL